MTHMFSIVWCMNHLIRDQVQGGVHYTPQVIYHSTMDAPRLIQLEHKYY